MSDLTEIDLPVINTVEDFKIHLINQTSEIQ